jgi:hypothetical protein
MIARFDHRPMLTATLALLTIVLLVVVVTLSTLLITLQPAASPPSASGGGNPAAQAQSGGGVGSGAGAYFGNDSLKEQQVPPVLPAQNGNLTLGQPRPAEPAQAGDSVERYRQATQ